MIAYNRRRLGWVLVLTSTAYFMVALDATVVATAQDTATCLDASAPN